MRFSRCAIGRGGALKPLDPGQLYAELDNWLEGQQVEAEEIVIAARVPRRTADYLERRPRARDLIVDSLTAFCRRAGCEARFVLRPVDNARQITFVTAGVTDGASREEKGAGEAGTP